MTATPTTGQVAAGYQRQVMALYYAYGRADAHAAPLVRVDPIAFSEHYMSLWEDFSNGQCSHMPSVQDAWDRFRRSLAS